MDYEALAKSLGGVPEKKAEKSRGSAAKMEISLKPVSSGKEPAQIKQDQTQEVIDYAKIAESLGGSSLPTEEPTTTLAGLAGAATRGLALPATGAALGAIAGAPIGGVGAIPGALAGAGAATLAGMIGDPVVSSINSLLGTKYTLPTQAMEDLLSRVGVAEPKTAAERIIQTTTSAGSGAGGMVAAGQSLASASSPIIKSIGQLISSAPSMQVTSAAAGGAAGQIAKESGAGTAGQIAATIGGSLLPAAPQIARIAAQKTAQAIAPKGAGIIERKEPTFGESVESIKSTVKEKISPEKQAEVVNKLISEPDSTDVVKYMLSGSQAVPDNLAGSALKQGWKEGAVASIKAASDADRTAMTKMLNVLKMGEKSEKFRAMNRPADILGDTVQSRVDFLTNSKNQAGKAIDTIARNELQGQRIDYNPAINSFLNDLGEIGVKVEIGSDGIARSVLQGSDIQGDKQAQRVLNSVLERLSNVKAPDAYGVHTAKRFIDTQVDYGKKNIANPLTSQAERILKNLRKNLNQTLGDANPNYLAANQKYSESITALNDLQKAAGTQIDFDSENANKALGTAMRKLTSNYGTRANLIDSLDQANQVASKYGMKLNDDIVNQLIFVNELDRMFGAAAQTSLKGQVSEAAQTGLDVARGKFASRAFDLLAEKAENLRGVNRENAIKSMEEILKRKSLKTPIK